MLIETKETNLSWHGERQWLTFVRVQFEKSENEKISHMKHTHTHSNQKSKRKNHGNSV